MNATLQRIALLLFWSRIWGTGGSLIDAALIQSGAYSLEGGQLGTATTFALWTLVWGALGLGLHGRIRPPGDPPESPAPPA